MLVQARLIDISRDYPDWNQSILVDTNVLIWLSYSRQDPEQPETGESAYAEYLKKIIERNWKIYHCAPSLSELSHHIERTEHKIYKHDDLSKRATDSLKRFRQMPAERKSVIEHTSIAFEKVKEWAPYYLPVNLDETASSNAIQRFRELPLDGYDVFIVEAMMQNKVLNILTNDGDYAGVPGINMFTVHSNALRDARANNNYTYRMPNKKWSGDPPYLPS